MAYDKDLAQNQPDHKGLDDTGRDEVQKRLAERKSEVRGNLADVQRFFSEQGQGPTDPANQTNG